MSKEQKLRKLLELMQQIIWITEKFPLNDFEETTVELARQEVRDDLARTL